MESIYVDTSTLAKWYLNERMSPEVERFIRGNDIDSGVIVERSVDDDVVEFISS